MHSIIIYIWSIITISIFEELYLINTFAVTNLLTYIRLCGLKGEFRSPYKDDSVHFLMVACEFSIRNAHEHASVRRTVSSWIFVYSVHMYLLS